MEYLRHRPGPGLAPFVAYLWSLHDAPPHATERIVPSGTLELVVNLDEDEVRVVDPRTGTVNGHSGAVVSGAYTRYFVIDPRQHAAMIGVHFRPGGARPFLGVPPGELADRHVDLEILWGHAAVTLRERLCRADAGPPVRPRRTRVADPPDRRAPRAPCRALRTRPTRQARCHRG